MTRRHQTNDNHNSLSPILSASVDFINAPVASQTQADLSETSLTRMPRMGNETGMEWSLCVVCSECWMVRRKQTVGGSNRQWWLVV